MADAAWWKSAVLGLVQGLTEFLPISSSGHLIAGRELLDFSSAPLAFDVALHVATLAAVLIYFRRDLGALARHPRRLRLLALLVLATLPAAALGKLLDEWREDPSRWWVVAGWSFSGCYLLASRGRGGATPYTEISAGRALGVGLAQALAIVPGVSRSGSSITGGLWLGLERDAACRFSFLLAIPTIGGAGLVKSVKLDAETVRLAGGWGALGLGMAVAFAVGLGSIHVLLGIVRNGRMHLFGLYNLAAAGAFAAFLLWRRG